MHQRRLPPLALAAALCLAPTPARAHEIPARIVVHAWVHASGDALRVALRIPLEAMRDLDTPMRADGTLELEALARLLPDAARLWIVPALAFDADGRALGAGRVVATRLSLPDDRAFDTHAGALAHFTAPAIPAGTALRWTQPLFDVLLEFPRGDPAAPLALTPTLAHLGIRTLHVLHVVGDDGAARTMTFEGDPGRILLAPRWHHAVGPFLGEGFRHILGGLDHLLFLLCLVLPVRRWRSLVAIVTAFTVAHSITLASAAVGFIPSALWFPPLVETLIAASIVWLCVENVFVTPERLERRWMLAFGFGLVHGFGFAFALGETLQFAGGHLAVALAAFNVGVEAGQLLVLAIMLPLLAALQRRVGATRERLVVLVGSALVAHEAWHWMTARGGDLAAHRASFRWPVLDATFALGAMRAALLAAVALAAALLLRHIFRVVRRPAPDPTPPVA